MSKHRESTIPEIEGATRIVERARKRLVFTDGERPSVTCFAKTKEASLNVLNEAAWDRVGRSVLASIDVVVPEVLDEGRDGELAWVKYEQLGGRALGDGERLVADPAFGGVIDRAVEIMQVLDGVQTTSPIPLSDPEDPEIYRQERTHRMQEGARQMVEQGVLTQTEVDEAAEAFSKQMRHYDRRLQHHDILPWHLFDLGDGRLGLIDAEFGGMRVRFYDAAYTLCKLHATIKNDEWTRRFWACCREVFGSEGFDEKVLLPMSFTAIREMGERHQRGDQEGFDRLKQLVHSVLHERPITF